MSDEYREKQYRESAKIERVKHGQEDHGIETVSILMAGTGWAQSFGNLAFRDRQHAGQFLASLCKVMGVSDPERLVGLECEVLREFPYLSEPIAGLRSKQTGRTFSIDAWARREDPAFRGTTLDHRYGDVEREIAHLRERIEILLKKATKLRSDYRPVNGEAP